MQTENNKVSALLAIETNDTPSLNASGGWNIPKECSRKDVFLNASVISGAKADCLLVNHSVFKLADLNNPIFKSIQDATAPLGGMPATTIFVHYELLGYMNFLRVRVYFNPELAGFAPTSPGTWAENPWHRVRATPDRVAYLRKVASWAEVYRKTVREGLD